MMNWRFSTTHHFLTLRPFLVPLFLHSRRQLAERQEAAGGRFHFIRHGPLQDDLGPRVIDDFHQAGGQGELVAEGDEGLGIRNSGLEVVRSLTPDP